MTNFTELTRVPCDRLVPVADPLRLAVAAYLARFKGSSREHTKSDLRCYLAWCVERGLDPLAARRPHLDTPLYLVASAGGTARPSWRPPRRPYLRRGAGSSPVAFWPVVMMVRLRSEKWAAMTAEPPLQADSREELVYLLGEAASLSTA